MAESTMPEDHKCL